MAARVFVLATWTPSLSDDLFRYRHEGRLTLHGICPYSYIPAEAGVRINPYNGQPIGIINHQTDLLDRMSNNGEIPAVYFPVSQFAFATTAWCEEHLVSAAPVEPQTLVPDGPARDALWLQVATLPAMLPYRVMSLTADLAVVGLLLLILARTKRSLWWATLYAWHPLALIEIAGNAHFEPLGIMFLLAGIYAVLWNRWNLAAVMLALALMVKPIALLAFPALLICNWYTQGRPNWRVMRLPFIQLSLVYVLTIIITILPFAGGLHDWRITLRIVADHFEFNGMLFEDIRWLVFGGNTIPVRYILHALSLLALAYIIKRAINCHWSMPQFLGHACVVFLLLAPQVYPWYALWPLALVPLAWNRASWVMSLTVILSYIVWPVFQSTGDWVMPSWAIVLEWIPVAVLEGVQLWRDCGTIPTPIPPSHPNQTSDSYSELPDQPRL